MKYFDWNAEKNAKLEAERGVTFEEVVFSVMHGGLLDIVVHPNQERYPGQRMLIVDVDDYAYLTAFVESEESIFLKTIIPSRTATRQYLEGRRNGP